MANFTEDYIFKIATSDAGMTKRHAVKFHAFNPNGAVKSLPDFDFFKFGDGSFALGVEMMYGQYDNYHAKVLTAWAIALPAKRFTKRDLQLHVTCIAEDRVEAHAAMKAKEEGLI
jgi:hypothetical protein